MAQPARSSVRQSKDEAVRLSQIAYQHFMSDLNNIEMKHQGVYFEVAVVPKDPRYPIIWPIVIRSNEYRAPYDVNVPILSASEFEKHFAEFQKSKEILQNLMRQAIEVRDKLRRQFDERYYNVVIRKLKEDPFY